MEKHLRQVFVHLHIPKCGGSTVVDILSRNFGWNLGNTNGILNDYQYSAAQVARIIENFPQLKCLTGHKLSLDLPFNHKDINLQVFTWVRDPVDRFISHYFYHRNHTTLVPEAKAMGICEYAEWALKQENQKMYINGQTRFLSGGSIEPIKLMIKNEKLLLFPLSRLQESFYTLAHKFPESFTDVITVDKNLSKKDQVVPDNFREIVLPYVEEDMKLMEISRQTMLKNTKPELGRKTKNKVIQRDLALKAARFLHRAANRIEKGTST